MTYSEDYDPYQVLKVFEALPAAGAFDTPREIAIVDFSEFALFLSYEDGGGTGGSVDVRIELSPHTSDAVAPANTAVWYTLTETAVATITPGTSAAVTVQDQITTFTPTTTSTEGVVITSSDVLQAQRLRISVAESGDIANPGNCSLILLAG